MAGEGLTVYKNKDQIVADLIAALLARIPDANIGPDAIFRILMEVDASTYEGIYLSQQLLHDDMFPQTASALALIRFGEEFGRPQKAGTLSTGEVTFSGAGGTFIASGTPIGAPRPAQDDTLMFETTDDCTIPDPGIPTAPTLTDHGSGAALAAATYEYAATFVTAGGETEIGAISAPIVMASAHSVDVAAVAVGGTGTTARKIYRRTNGGAFGLVKTLADNATTTFTDADAAPGDLPPTEDTSEQVTVAAQSSDVGVDYNVAANAVTSVSESGLSGVTNTSPFTGGSDVEDVETFRQELIEHIAAPQSGSAADLVSWATSISGVDSATAFPNVDLDGDDAPGTVSVRIVPTGGGVPSDDLKAAVLAELEAHDLANITILVGGFDAEPVDFECAVALDGSYTLDDVTVSVEAAVTAYIDSVPVGGTVYVAGLVSAIYGLPGVLTVTISTPTDDVALDPTQKAIAGTLTVNSA